MQDHLRQHSHLTLQLSSLGLRMRFSKYFFVCDLRRTLLLMTVWTYCLAFELSGISTTYIQPRFL